MYSFTPRSTDSRRQRTHYDAWKNVVFINGVVAYVIGALQPQSRYLFDYSNLDARQSFDYPSSSLAQPLSIPYTSFTSPITLPIYIGSLTFHFRAHSPTGLCSLQLKFPRRDNPFSTSLHPFHFVFFQQHKDDP